MLHAGMAQGMPAVTNLSQTACRKHSIAFCADPSCCPAQFPAAHAARPLLSPTADSSSARQLQQWNNNGWGNRGGGYANSFGNAWGGGGRGGGGCPSPSTIGFGKAKALGIVGKGLVAGNVLLFNKGPRPFAMRGAGFRLAGGNRLNPINGNLRCPNTLIPAGGSLNCGFLAHAQNPLAYNAFAPYFIPDIGGASPCFCQQPFPVQPFYGAGGPSRSVSNAQAVTQSGVAKGLAEALSQAWGGPAYSEAVSNAKSFNGDAYGLADAVADAVYGPAEANAASTAETQFGAANANSKAAASSIGGPATANGLARGTAWNGAATANSLANGQAWGGPAFVNNAAIAQGRWGAQSNAAGRGQAWGGPAVTQSSASSDALQGPSLASNQAQSASNQAALAAGSAQAKTGSGPAAAKSSSGAIVSGGNGGIAAATDRADALSGFGPAQAQVGCAVGVWDGVVCLRSDFQVVLMS